MSLSKTHFNQQTSACHINIDRSYKASPHKLDASSEFHLEADSMSLPIHAKAETDMRLCKFYASSLTFILSFSLPLHHILIHFFTNHLTDVGTSGYRMEICEIEAVDKASESFKLIFPSLKTLCERLQLKEICLLLL